MRSLFVALLLAASPQTPAQKAKELSGQKSWEELYLAFASGDATAVPEEQRATVSSALVKGCQALMKDDTVMAYSMGERAVLFEESAPALRCLASAARMTEQRAAAESALVKGVTRFPKDGSFPLELGKLLLEEQDFVGAQAALEKVPPRVKESAEAKKLLQQTRQHTLQEDAARSEAARIEKSLGGGPRRRGQAVLPTNSSGGEETSVVSLRDDLQPGMSIRTPTVGFESGLDRFGRRTRANSRFVVSYYDNGRDFAQRTDYEGKVVEVLDEAYHFTRNFLGVARETPVSVVLYTAREFHDTFGAMASESAAGMYFKDAIRINNAVELTRQTKATLVHEYVHATVADICGGGNRDAEVGLPFWLNEGLAEHMEERYLGVEGPNKVVQSQMKIAVGQRQIHLRDMVDKPPIQMWSPALAYSISAVAVRELLRQEGTHRLLTLIREVCSAPVTKENPFEEALRTHYGKTMEDLEEAVDIAFKKR